MKVHHARLPLVNLAQVEKYDHDKYETEGHHQISMQTVLIDDLSAIMYLWSLESLPVALLFDCGLRCDIPYFLKFYLRNYLSQETGLIVHVSCIATEKVI